MASTAERIKERLGIVDVISSYIKVESAGANFKARCPFHNEKTPSFFISPSRNNYYCFGCGQKGDIFSFVQEYEKLDFLGALKVLAERAGVQLDEFRSDAYKKSERQYRILDEAASFYERCLDAKDGANGAVAQSARKYLADRGLSEASAKEWRIGFAPDEWRSVSDYLLNHRVDGQTVTLNEMEQVGLIKQNDGKSYDRFRSRIMFPLFDSSGRVIGFSGRIFGKDADAEGPNAAAKYLNSPDSQVFNKSEVLYGFDRAKHSIREWGYAILVEGQMDLLMSHQVGVKNAVATSGTALTPLHLEKIGRMTKNLIFMYDADKAGYGATRRGERLAIEQGFDVKVVTLPKGEDPASLIKKDKAAFVQALKNSTHVVEYYLGVLVERYPADQDNGHELIKAIEKEIVPDIALTPSSIKRGELISLVAARGLKSKIHEKHISDEVDNMVRKIAIDGREAVLGMTAFSPSNSSSRHSTDSNNGGGKDGGNEKIMSGNMYVNGEGGKAKTPVDVALRRTLALMTYIDSLIEQGKSQYAKVKEDAETQFGAFMQGDDAKLVEELRASNHDELLFEGEAFFAQSEKLDEHLFDLIYELEERSLKKKLSEHMSQLSLAEGGKDRVKSDEIIQKCQEISLRLSELHRKKRR
jgi:DNA primase